MKPDSDMPESSELSDFNFKITLLRNTMDKVENMQEHMDNVTIETKSLKKIKK